MRLLATSSALPLGGGCVLAVLFESSVASHGDGDACAADVGVAGSERMASQVLDERVVREKRV